MDHIIVYGANQPEHDERLEAVLTSLQWAKVMLNWEKCDFSKETVKFLSHLVGKDGIRPDPSKVSAVKHITEPTDIHELQRFLGMVNQSGKYVPRRDELTHPLRELLSKKKFGVLMNSSPLTSLRRKWALTQSSWSLIPHSRLLCQLMHFRMAWGQWWPRNSRIETGNQWSSYLGHFPPPERRYAQIEKEALATTWACEWLADYLTGKQFHVATNRKPLVPILG